MSEFPHVRLSDDDEQRLALHAAQQIAKCEARMREAGVTDKRELDELLQGEFSATVRFYAYRQLAMADYRRDREERQEIVV